MAKTAKKTPQKKVYQVGNFFVKRENEHYKMYDANQVWSMRVHFLSSMYIFIDACIEKGNMELLEIVVKMHYFIGTTPPDVDFIKDAFTAYTALMDRTRENMQSTEQEDAQNLERAKTMHEATEKVMEAINEGPQTDTQG